MGLYLESWLSELLAVALVAAAGVYAWYSHRYSYWTKKGVIQAPPVIPFGNIAREFLGMTRLSFIFQELYIRYRDQKYVGVYLFSKPALLLIDPDLNRLVLVKDFDAFSDRDTEFDEKEPLNYHLFNLNGHRWKRLRSKMSPAFTTGKLKIMCQTMQDCGRQLLEVLEEPAAKGQSLEMREITARFTTDIVASVGFGIEVNSQKDPDTTFRKWGRKLSENSVNTFIIGLLYKFFPVVAKALRLEVEAFKIIRYFRDVVTDTVSHRERHGIERNDFLNLMMKLKNKGFIDEQSKTGSQEIDNWKFTIDDVAAQSILFYAAGFETSSTTMSFALYELALNQDVQKRLHEEVDATLKENSGELTYEAISSMKYLDKVISETLRKHSPVGHNERRCTRDIQLPDGGPLIEKGTIVLIPMHALNLDPEYYPDPQRFDPERFSEEQKAARHPYIYMPFGSGPRNCIGMRLGLLQAKIGLAYMMTKYEVHPCEETKVPLQYGKIGGVLTSATGIHLKVAQRK